jgi:hypothetical protein
MFNLCEWDKDPVTVIAAIGAKARGMLPVLWMLGSDDMQKATEVISADFNNQMGDVGTALEDPDHGFQIVIFPIKNSTAGYEGEKRSDGRNRREQKSVQSSTPHSPSKQQIFFSDMLVGV